MSKIMYKDAIRDALIEEMTRDPRIFLLGEDIEVYGGAFRVTEKLNEMFPGRVMDTPISEEAITGVTIGAAIAGKRPIMEMMYADWTGLTLDQMVNQASLLHYVWNGQVTVPMVYRMQGGARASASAQHSKSLEAWFCHIPGIKVVMPSNAYDAKGLLKAAIRDENPVVFIEHKRLYGTRAEVPEGDYIVEIGKGDVKREGTDVTIVATSAMVLEALDAAAELEKEGISCEVVDPRTLIPLDKDTIRRSLEKTNKLVVVNEAWKTGSFAAEIVAVVAEEMFELLDAPIVRLGALDMPIPYSPALEPLTVPNKDTIAAAVRQLMAG